MKVAVLLSGGVDSSVALYLAKQKGYEVKAFYLKIWLQEDLVHLSDCPWEEDLDYATKICNQLDVPLQVISLQNEYWQKVVQYVLKEIKIGNTPNGDLYCNSFIKFGSFIEKVSSYNFDKIVSGHYAKIIQKNNFYHLALSKDSFKDQSYFLAYLSQQQLNKVMFPLADYKKKEVRQIAIENNFANATRKDSQGICFLGKIKYNEFISHHFGKKKGDIIEKKTDKKWGEHNGFWFHTIGQRKGLGLSGGPWYVVDKDIEKNIIYIDSKEDSIQNNDYFFIQNCNWFNPFWVNEIIKNKPSLQVKIRHGEFFHNCTLQKEKQQEDKKYKVSLQKKDQGIATGQIAVFYQDNICLGGGTICF